MMKTTSFCNLRTAKFGKHILKIEGIRELKLISSNSVKRMVPSRTRWTRSGQLTTSSIGSLSLSGINYKWWVVLVLSLLLSVNNRFVCATTVGIESVSEQSIVNTKSQDSGSKEERKPPREHQVSQIVRCSKCLLLMNLSRQQKQKS